MSESLLACRWCGQAHAAAQVPRGQEALCRRCGLRLDVRRGASLRRTLAFTSAALLLYVPANVLPILRLNMYGATTDNTVWQGCVKLWQSGDPAVALIVFLASIAVPLLKLLGLLALALTGAVRSPRARRARTAAYRVIDAIGRWAMLDVFVLAIVVSLIRLQRLASAEPGAGALPFCGVVAFTLLASASFDPRLIWEDEPS